MKKLLVAPAPLTRTVALAFLALAAGSCVVRADTARVISSDPVERDVMAFGLDPYPDGFETTYDGYCLWDADNRCLALDLDDSECALDTPMDLIFAGSSVAAVLCYPVGDPVYELSALASDVVIPSGDSGASVEFTPSSDGAYRHGNLTIYADDVILYGLGPSRTILDGNLIVYGDWVQLRGFTLLGDLILDGYAPDVVYADVYGTVLATGSSGVYAGNRLYGDVSLVGGDDLLVANGVQGELALDPSSSECHDNYSFIDSDGDGALDSSEPWSPIVCR